MGISALFSRWNFLPLALLAALLSNPATANVIYWDLSGAVTQAQFGGSGWGAAPVAVGDSISAWMAIDEQGGSPVASWWLGIGDDVSITGGGGPGIAPGPYPQNLLLASQSLVTDGFQFHLTYNDLLFALSGADAYGPKSGSLAISGADRPGASDRSYGIQGSLTSRRVNGVPEPGTLALMAVGLAGLGVVGYVRRRAARRSGAFI